MQITQGINTGFVQGVRNSLAKGYYPTFPKDVENIKKVLRFDFGYDHRSINEKIITVFDPCAGEGAFLSSIARYAKRTASASNVKNVQVCSYAVELDNDRFKTLRGVDQAVNSSFFEVSTSMPFDVVLLNPPYNKAAGELMSWVERAAPMVANRGAMVLIIPKSELTDKMIHLLRGSFSYRYAYLSDEFAKFKQVVVYLSNFKDNGSDHFLRMKRGYAHLANQEADNLEDTPEDPIKSYLEKPVKVEIRPSESSRPLLSSLDLSDFYLETETLIDNAVSLMLDKEYPSNFDSSIQPVSTIRTAHAVQLAAMNSQIECVEINGEIYMAKFMLTQKAETYVDVTDDGKKTTSVVYKPTVETFLLSVSGEKKLAKDWGFDAVDLNFQLSAILLTKLSRMYQPLHEIGQDEEYLADELKQIGLKAPQRETVKAVMKAFANGRRGIGVRANTGTGKTWIAKAVKYISGAKRTVMISEPQLIPQLAKEYENEGFKVHVIDSWEKMVELEKTRPKGLYLMSYTRLRQYPNRLPVTRDMRVKTSDGYKYAPVCTNCHTPSHEKVRKGDKTFCLKCGHALFTYIAENPKPFLRYKQWISDIEACGKSKEIKSHNKQLPYLRYLKKISFDLAIFDEAHNAANLMSNQGTAFIRLAATAKKVLCLTATVTNGMAKSLYNLLWGINPEQMKEAGWSPKSATEFQTKLGAFKEVHKTDDNNRHRGSEGVTTYDIAGISPAALVYTLPNFVNMDSEDFDDLPPVEREVIKCNSHPEVESCMRGIENIISNADLPKEDRLAAQSVRNAAFMRVSDTFHFADDELCLRGVPLGTLHRKGVTGLLEQEQRLVEIVQGAVDRGERILIYTGLTQHIDLRPHLKGIISRNVAGVTIDVLSNTIAPEKLMKWFETAKGTVAIVSYHRVATGLNLSQYNNLAWYDYTSNTRLAEQGEGRIRRVNTADIHRAMFGEVRPVRYWYLTSSKLQEMQLGYTLEKRMIAKLAEGETPDIDPSECASGDQSFSAMITKALNEGNFVYNDPSALLKRMTKSENAGVKQANLTQASPLQVVQPVVTVVEPIAQVEPVTVEAPTRTVIYMVDRKEEQREISEEVFNHLEASGLLEQTFFGIYVIERKQKYRKAA